LIARREREEIPSPERGCSIIVVGGDLSPPSHSVLLLSALNSGWDLTPSFAINLLIFFVTVNKNPFYLFFLFKLFFF